MSSTAGSDRVARLFVGAASLLSARGQVTAISSDMASASTDFSTVHDWAVAPGDLSGDLSANSTDQAAASDLASGGSSDIVLGDSAGSMDQAMASVDFAATPLDLATPFADLTGSMNGCGSGLGSLDQAQLSDPGGAFLGISSTQSAGQKFTAGATGTLSAIEIGMCANAPVPSNSSFKLTVLNGSGHLYGNLTRPLTDFPCSQGGLALAAGQTGPGLWDLSSLCIPVTAGQQYIYIVSVVSSQTYTGGRQGEAQNAYSGGPELAKVAGGYAATFKTFVR